MENQLQRKNAYMMLLCWVAYFVLYYLTENLIPPERFHLIHIPLDDRIPFREEFAVFYVGWYGLVAISLLYFLLRDQRSFRQLQTYFIIVQLLATAVYLLYPTYQDLRPAVFPRENLLTKIMAFIYRLDTPTGVCPSLHVAMSAGIGSVWLKRRCNLWLKGGIAFFCLGVCASVVFVKQHSAADVFAAIPLCLIAQRLVFYRNSRAGACSCRKSI